MDVLKSSHIRQERPAYEATSVKYLRAKHYGGGPSDERPLVWLLWAIFVIFKLYRGSEAYGIKTKYINYDTLIIHSSISGRVFLFYSPNPRNQVRIKYIEKFPLAAN